MIRRDEAAIQDVTVLSGVTTQNETERQDVMRQYAMQRLDGTSHDRTQHHGAAECNGIIQDGAAGLDIFESIC